MTAPFRLYGAEFSAYSLKLRSYLRYKGVPFEFLARTQARAEEVARYAKSPLSPILVDADDAVMQDSTTMIEALERDHPEPSITLDDPALRFVACLLEDYADEWLSKAMFHYRWSHAEDAAGAAKRTIDMLFEGAEAPEGLEEAIKTRMAGRLHHVGAGGDAAAVIEGSFTRLLDILDRHLSARAYLFGARPCVADFGLAAQLGQLLSDPTPGALIKAKAPNVVQWIDRMESPNAEGAFAEFDALRDGLAALLRDEVAGGYLAWMAANAQAVADDAQNVTVSIGDAIFSQKPQRYAAKALAELRRKRAAESDNAALNALLADTGCDVYLAADAVADADDDESEPEPDLESGSEE